MPNVQRLLDERVRAAMGAAYPEAADAPAIVQPAQDPRFGDYQANGAMGLAKRLKRNPREVAQAVVAALDVADLAEPPEIAGPGFINLRLRRDWLGAQAGRLVGDDRLGVAPAETPETVVVDYSAPNLAKEMHVGHLRSTIIGDALVRMLDFAGHNVQRQNHVGDWGTQFGMLVAHLDDEVAGGAEIEAELADLEAFYRDAKARFDSDPAFADRARRRVVQLQSGDPDTYATWERFLAASMAHCRQVYRRLGVLLTDGDVRGESAYNDVLGDVVAALRAKGLLTESEGAQCVFLKNAGGEPLFASKDGDPLPLIVQKSDEGFLYATTDLAAVAFRTGYFAALPDGSPSPHAGRALYCVDARQALHFRMVFECAAQAGFAERGRHALVHVAFGTMMGPDGKPFKTREGGTVKLAALLDEAEVRARALVLEKNPELAAEEAAEVARTVGIGAVKYADLAQNRTSDTVFSWDKMLSFDGNTAPYMQYAYARIRSILRKYEAETGAAFEAAAGPLALEAPEEGRLARTLLQLPETLDRALADYRPHLVAAYLYDLAQAFTAFYEACPVLKSEAPTRTARLTLSALTARVIRTGLGLLGIETTERM